MFHWTQYHCLFVVIYLQVAGHKFSKSSFMWMWSQILSMLPWRCIEVAEFEQHCYCCAAYILLSGQLFFIFLPFSLVVKKTLLLEVLALASNKWLHNNYYIREEAKKNTSRNYGPNIIQQLYGRILIFRLKLTNQNFIEVRQKIIDPISLMISLRKFMDEKADQLNYIFLHASSINMFYAIY